MAKKSDLSIRETILGVIKAKDLDGTGIIHSSDFRNAIKDLGFPPGSSIIESILVHCQLEANGTIDYSSFEREVIRERRVQNAHIFNSKPETLATSNGAAPKPWGTDLVHQQKVSSKRQSKLVHEHRSEVHEIYNLLSHHDISANDAVFHLGQLEIFPTKEFMKQLTIMSNSEISFADFIRSLTQYDPNSSQLLEDKNISAGGSRRPVHVDDTMGTQRKRSALATKTNFFGENATKEERYSQRKIVGFGSNAITDQTIFKTTRVKDCIFSDADNVSLLSHAQQDMVNGAFAESNKESIELAFNWEQRLQREHVLAAIRKLHSCELTMEDFQDQLFSMGFDLPETIAAELRRAVASGSLDQRRFVQMLDATVFKVSALDDCKSSTDAKLFKQRFITSIRRKGLNSILELGQLFRKLDLDSDGSLSFSEFRKGVRDFDLYDLDDSELRCLFNSFDKNGDGVLQAEEFLEAIRGQLNPKRLAVVRKAFLKMNRYAQPSVSLDLVAEQLQAIHHPEVQSGEKSERKVRNEFVVWFSTAPNFDGSITQADFEDYFASISGYIPYDSDFEAMIKSLWGLDDTYAPPPPEYHQRQGPPVPPPQAKQSHGDLLTWGQQKTRLEINMAGVEKGKKIVTGYENKNLHTNVKISQDTRLGTKALDFVPEEEWLGGVKGSIRVEKGMKNVSSRSLLDWKTQRGKPVSPVKPASYKVTLDQQQQDVEDSAAAVLLPYQLDVPQAGTPSYTKRNVNDNPSYTWSDIRKAHHGTAPPFGVDGSGFNQQPAAQNNSRPIANASNSPSSNSQQPRSLSEALKAKKSEPRSLASLMAQRQ